MRQALTQETLKTIYRRVAGRYDFQHAFFTAKSDQRGRRILVDKTVATGDAVLDCGAGTGSTGLMAAQKTGVDGKVVLFDLSEDMLGVAKQKAAQLELQCPLEFRVGDMLDLPFPDNSFDVVLSSYSMCPIYDPAQGAKELYRVTRPGGLIGVAHSADPQTPWVKWLADQVENLVWLLPSLSLGCRSVKVLPSFEAMGCRTIFSRHIGIVLWPFVVFVVQKQTKNAER